MTHKTAHYLSIDGHKIHYIDEGQGDPIVFIHGIPTSSYLWRHVIPSIKGLGRCIALDLIGMGLSDKPDIDYRIFDHIHYVTQFLDQLQLDKITFVLHGWGSLIGFSYAMRHPDKIKGLAFFESHVRAHTDYHGLSLPIQDRIFLLGDAQAARRQIIEDNYFVETFLKRGTLVKLDPQVMAHYRKPFQTPDSRRVLWQYFKDFPLNGQPKDVIELIQDYTRYLTQSPVPKLMMYAVPGFLTDIDTVIWCKDNLPALMLVDLGNAMHFAQESIPDEFSKVLATWLNIDHVSHTYKGTVLH